MILEPTIIFEDDHVIALNKPSGLIVHPDGRTVEPSITEWILKKYPALAEVGETQTLSNGTVIHRPGIVHRLDRDTSGVLLVCKDQPTFERLKEQFQSREIEKVYSAFVYGEMKTEDGTIDRPIGRSRSDFRLWSAQRLAKGEMREAVTDYVVVARTHTDGPDSAPRVASGYTLLEVRPKTGRTHQIRVHFKAIHHPIVADSLYAPKQQPGLGFERLALHSRSIQYIDHTGKQHKIVAPYPADFEKAIAEIKTL
jgi:23S rRNA pseudouridine1911/1915/1917 synthase